MKKFTIISKKGVTTLQEVEVEYVTPMQDPSVMWLGEGEFKFKVIKPETLLEKQADGSLVPPIWCWHAFYSCEVNAREAAEKALREELQRDARKSRTEFDEAEYQRRCSEIRVATL